MELPQIIQDEKAMKSQLTDLIQQRYELSSKESRFNFEKGQLNLINNMQNDDQLIKALHNLLESFLKNRIQNGYCYYTLKGVLENGMLDKSAKIVHIEEQTKLIGNKNSQFNKINHLILMRQILLGKFEDKVQINKQMLEYIDDIRFITQEIINVIRKWKKSLQEQGLQSQNIIYIYKNYNYITKIIIDNTAIIANFNKKQDMFLSCPNPFFLMTNSKVKGLSSQTINSLNEILSEEKAQQLKMMLDSPYLKSLKNVQLQNQLKQLRSKVEEDKVDKIRTIYQAGQSTSQDFKMTSGSRIMSLNKQRVQNITTKNKESIKNLDQLIKQKQIEVLKDMKKKKIVHHIDKKEDKDNKKGVNALGYKSKLQSLRAQVEKNVKLNKQKEKRKSPLPKVEAELRSTKPKIKVVCERDVAVENTVKNIFDMMLGQSKEQKLNRSRSTFYKQIKIGDEKQQKQKDLVSQSNRNIMINSAYSFKSLPYAKKQRSTSVNFKLRKTSATKKAKANNDSKNQSRQQQANEVKQSLAILQNRIREQSIKNIYSNRTQYNKTSTGFKNHHSRSKSIDKDVSLQKKNDIKQDNVSRVKNFQMKNTTFEDKLKQKQKNIQELKQRLKSLRANNSDIPSTIQNTNLQKSGVTQSGNFKEERQKLQLQNIRIKQEMKLQQMKYLALKEQEYKLKEQQMQNRYKHKLDKIKQELIQKQKDFEGKIGIEKKKNQQMQQRYKQVTKQTQTIKFQLQQKQIKQQLISEIIKQEALKRQKEKQYQQEEERSFLMMQEFRREQEKYKQELQRKAMEIFEEEKLKLRALQIQIQKKNKQLEQRNRKQLQQIQRLEIQKAKQQEQLQKLQIEVEEKEKDIRLEQHLQSQNAISLQSVDTDKLDADEIQQLKARIKMELIEEIKKKRQQQQEQQKNYQESRRQHLLELEEQMRKAMRFQDDELQKIQEQYRLKNQQMIRQYEQQMLRKQRQKDLIEEQSKKKIEQAQYRQPFQLQKLVNIETGLQNGPTSRIQEKQQQEKKEEKIEKNIEEIEEKKEQIQAINKITEEKPQQEKPQLEKHDQQVKQQKIESPEKKELNQEPQPAKVEAETQSPTKMPEQIQKPTQAIKQNTQQVKSKYDHLLSLISKPIKQLFFSQGQIEPYLNKYYSLLQPQVKQMLPYSRKDIEAMFKSKKMDVFDNYSFGWYRPKQKKFMLLGSFEAIPMIGAKYGEIQIEQVFIFNKGNAYQKQFLSKLIKIYQKIGYIYQKKTNEEGKYSIKFIVKAPKQVSQEPLTDNLEIKTSVIFEEHSLSQEQFMKSNCIYYLLTQGLAQLLSQEQKIQIAGKDTYQHKYINKKINDEPMNNDLIKTQKHTDRITQVSLSIPINYMQTIDQSFYAIKSTQYELSSDQQKIYVSFYKQQKIALVVYKMTENDVPRDFHLDSFIQTKLKSMDEDKQVQLFLPIWESKINFKAKASSPRPFAYRQTSKPDLAYGSVVSSRVHKGQFLYLQPPFVFVVFQLNNSNMLRRILFGHIVTDEEVVKTKRVLTTF